MAALCHLQDTEGLPPQDGGGGPRSELLGEYGLAEHLFIGMTGRAEAVRVVYDPSRVSYESLLKVFWAAHDPMQGVRQGNDVGTQYCSAIFGRSKRSARGRAYVARCLSGRPTAVGFGPITTEIVPPAPPFFFPPGLSPGVPGQEPEGI